MRRRHDGRHLRLDRRAEGDELHLTQALDRMLDERQLVMRVGTGVAVAGEMLPARRHSRVLQRANDRATQRRDEPRFFRERTIANHRILRVRVHVEHGPTALSSAASARAKRSASATLPLRPSVAFGGHSVNGRFSRATRPPS